MEPYENKRCYDKRCYERYDYSCPLSLYRTDDLTDSLDQLYSATMKDYSQGGMSFLTNEQFTVGQKVYIEMKKYNRYATGPEKYKGYDGYVKWASPHLSSYADNKRSYRYGIENHELYF